MGYFVLRCLYYLLPGIVGNTAPILVKGICKGLAVPVDFGREIGGKRIFGDHKTIRGIVFAILLSVVIAYCQRLLYRYPVFEELSFLDYDAKWLPVGVLIGAGVMAGDLANSFAKRRCGIQPGKPFVPFDQINAVVGGLVFLLPVYVTPIGVAATLILIAAVVHVGFSLLGHAVGLKKDRL